MVLCEVELEEEGSGSLKAAGLGLFEGIPDEIFRWLLTSRFAGSITGNKTHSKISDCLELLW